MDKQCIGCPYQPHKVCGQMKPKRGSSASVVYVQVPDKRCIYRGFRA